MFVDTHTHLYDDRLTEAKQDEMIRRAFEAGVAKLYMPNCDQHTIPGMMRIAGAFPDRCLPMMGLHPTYVKDEFESELAIVRDWLDKATFAAIGEIGLDYYWDNTPLVIERQKMAFSRQVDWALEKNLPVVIHSREATQDCIDIVREKQNGSLRGIFHCFSGTAAEAEQIIALDFKLGIGGIVTYKSNREIQDLVSRLPLESIVLETDAPYLSPVPYRGKRNESGYIPFIAEKVAELRNLSIEEIGRITSENSAKLFPC